MTKASGVYAIIHRESGKPYIGSAVNIARRWNEHRLELSRNIHHSRRLQNAWNKHGEDAFVFVVVRFCPVADLIAEEQRWIDEIEASGRHGYNSCPTAGSKLGVKLTRETRAKMSAAQRRKKLTPETRAKIAAANRKRATAQRGRKHTPESRAKMAAAHKGRKHTPEHVANNAAARRGRKHTPEHVAKVAAAKRGKKLTPEGRANIAAANRKRAAEQKAAKLARMAMVQGELFP